MAVSGVLCLIPEDATRVPAPGTAARVAHHLLGTHFPPEPSSATTGSTVRLSLQPRRRDVELVRFGDEYLPFHIVVEEFAHPVAEVDARGLRYCRTCEALVETLAECSACGVEEDPSEWRIGPSKVLFVRAFELAVVVEGGPDIWPLSDGQVDRLVRDYLGAATVAEAEAAIGPLRLVRSVG